MAPPDERVESTLPFVPRFVSALAERVTEIEAASEAPKRQPFRNWLKRLIAEETNPALLHAMPDQYAHEVWLQFLFDVCRRKVEGLAGRAELIKTMRAWMRTTCRAGWIGPEVRCTNESFQDLQRAWRAVSQEDAA